jgi:hypothetical protein
MEEAAFGEKSYWRRKRDGTLSEEVSDDEET